MNFQDFTHDWLFRTTLEGSVLIVTVLTLSRVLGGRLGPRWRVALWTVVGLKLLVPAFMPSLPGLGNWFRPPVAMTATEMIPADAAAAPMVEAGTGAGVLMSVTPASTGDVWPLIFGVVWALGAIAFLCAILWRQHRYESGAGLVPCRDPDLIRLVRKVARESGVGQDIRIVLGPAGGTPAVCGVRRARLVLPGDWECRFDAAALRLILMHELEHVRRHDVLQNWVAALVHAVHWFNPLVWVAVSRFQSDRELLCDARTLSRLEPAERIDYGRTLLRVQSDFFPAPAIAGVAPCVRNHPTLQQRIEMITNPVRKNAWLNAMLVPGVAGILAISFGSATADEKRAPEEGERPRGEEREGERPRPEGAPREGAPREGGPREGAPREGGPREGGPREGGPREGGPREGGPREGGRPHHEGRPGPHPGEIAVFVVPEGARIGDRFIPIGKLRGELVHMKARVAVVSAEPQIPFHQVNQVVDALRDVGIRDVRIGGPRPGPREGGPRPEGAPRDGDRPRPEGAPRDGDRPRPEGVPRDGDRPRPEGAPRDGDRPRPEGAPRDGDRPRPEGVPRDGDRPRPEGAPRDGDRPRPEGAPRDGDRPRPEA